ncbi:17196_t:CDS:1, partial [Dentiscutata erythropus]
GGLWRPQKGGKFAKMSKKGTQNLAITRNESSISSESSDTIATSTSQSQDIQVADGS